ncbi:MAG: xanthine dehydrogenase family protein molybdopterin-binding subunit [SAR202 cluster bacterium]|nr:xanthine dehydrogenase family protein molybdopterin-binding subunit [SAR202 cluster bacterium]
MVVNIVLSEKEYKVVGTRPIRHDGVDKVTGRAKYGGDFTTTGLLFGKILRSPHAHAQIESINIDKALELDGVVSVVTASDLPVSSLSKPSKSLELESDNILARKKVLYKGHAVAAVCATNSHIAEDALKLIEVKYKALDPVIDVLKAMDKDSILLHDDLTTRELGQDSGVVSNIATHLRYELGDVEKGFAEADVIVEEEFDTSTVHQGYIEPHNATAFWSADGHIDIWCSTQGSFTAREKISKVLDVPVSTVTVTPMEIGGGFGGKIPVYLEPIAALLSKKSGAPVKMLMSRSDCFESTGPTCGSYVKVKMGAKNDGTLVAAQAYLVYEAGAFPGSNISAGGQCVFAPYDIPNMEVDGYDVLVNKPKTAAYRAPGAPNAAFASEQVVDELCVKLGIDPVDFRIKNASTDGTRRVDGPIFNNIGNLDCLDAVKNSEHYKSKLKGKYTGRGIASGYWMNIGKQSSCSIGVNSDGTLGLIEGSTDIGGSRTSIAMQAAEVLGVPAESIRPSVGDTDSIGYTFLTGGSRVTFASGWAAYECAQSIKTLMEERAAAIWGVSETDVELVDGILKHKSDTELVMPFKELASQLNDTGGPISAQVSVDPTGSHGAFSTHIVDVEVDIETGKVSVLRYTSVQDVGKAIHPSYVEGQMQGAAVQGIGWALNEEYYYNSEGGMNNSSFLDYRMPTSLDLPMLETIIVECHNQNHPYGVRGVGEVAIVPPLPAIANAVKNAIGHRMCHLPMSPKRILEAVESI